MINFSSDILQEQIAEAIKTLDYLTGDIEDIQFDDLLVDGDTEHDVTIGEESDVCIYIGEDDYPSLTVKQFIELAHIQNEISINKDQSYAKSHNEVFFLLDSFDYETSEILDNTFKENPRSYTRNQKSTSALTKSVKVKAKTYTCSCTSP